MFNPEATLPLIAISILLGFVGLIWSADRFVAAAAAIAKSMGLSPLLIGLTIVSFGTSAPEIMVSLSASLKGAGDLAVGNAIGSNIANIGLVLAATTLMASIPVQVHILRHEMPILLGVTLLSGFFLWDAVLRLHEGLILALVLLPAIYYLVKMKSSDLSEREIAEEEPDIKPMRRAVAIAWFVFSLLLLMLSSEVLVWGAKSAALLAGVSPLIIGLTVIAVGTSLPELAASMVSAHKGHHDIALGNIIGSNMFNLMAVMSISGIVTTTTMEPSVFSRDYLVMLGLTVILALAIGIAVWRKGAAANLGKPIGLILLVIYIAYYITLFKTVRA